MGNAPKPCFRASHEKFNDVIIQGGNKRYHNAKPLVLFNVLASTIIPPIDLPPFLEILTCTVKRDQVDTSAAMHVAIYYTTILSFAQFTLTLQYNSTNITFILQVADDFMYKDVGHVPV